MADRIGPAMVPCPYLTAVTIGGCDGHTRVVFLNHSVCPVLVDSSGVWTVGRATFPEGLLCRQRGDFEHCLLQAVESWSLCHIDRQWTSRLFFGASIVMGYPHSWMVSFMDNPSINGW